MQPQFFIFARVADYPQPVPVAHSVAQDVADAVWDGLQAEFPNQVPPHPSFYRLLRTDKANVIVLLYEIRAIRQGKRGEHAKAILRAARRMMRQLETLDGLAQHQAAKATPIRRRPGQRSKALKEAAWGGLATNGYDRRKRKARLWLRTMPRNWTPSTSFPFAYQSARDFTLPVLRKAFGDPTPPPSECVWPPPGLAESAAQSRLHWISNFLNQCKGLIRTAVREIKAAQVGLAASGFDVPRSWIIVNPLESFMGGMIGACGVIEIVKSVAAEDAALSKVVDEISVDLVLLKGKVAGLTPQTAKPEQSEGSSGAGEVPMPPTAKTKGEIMKDAIQQRVPQSFVEIADTARLLYSCYPKDATEYRRAKSGLEFCRNAAWRADPEQATNAFPAKGTILYDALHDYTCQSDHCREMAMAVGNLGLAVAQQLPALWPSLRLIGVGMRWHEDEGFNWDAAIGELRQIEAAALSASLATPVSDKGTGNAGSALPPTRTTRGEIMADRAFPQLPSACYDFLMYLDGLPPHLRDFGVCARDMPPGVWNQDVAQLCIHHDLLDILKTCPETERLPVGTPIFRISAKGAACLAEHRLLDNSSSKATARSEQGTSNVGSMSLVAKPEQRDGSLAQGKRFRVALSFPGVHRPFGVQVADILADRLERRRVFYDGYYEAELARPNLDTYLQQNYHDDSDLIAVFLCAEYEKKDWCGLEWRAIRDLIKKRNNAAIMPFRFDATTIPGLFSIDGYVEIGKRSPAEVASLILERLEHNDHRNPSA